MASRQRAQDDANAAYLNALRWIISGDCAVRIFNAWSKTVSERPQGTDQPGLELLFNKQLNAILKIAIFDLRKFFR